jgi:uncharacterized protein
MNGTLSMDENKEEFPELNINASVIFESSLGFAGIFLGWLFGQNVLQMIRFVPADFIFSIEAVLPMFVIPLLVLILPFKPFRDVRDFMDGFMYSSFRRSSVINLFLISLLSGISEEILFRGFLQNIAVKYTGLIYGIALVSAVFGLTHFVTGLYVILTAVMGAYLGYLYYYTGNLLVPIIAHSFYNFTVFLYFMKIRNKPKI